MMAYQKHVFVLGGIVIFLVIGFWFQFGYYLKLGASRTFPHAFDFVSQYLLTGNEERNGTIASANWQSDTYTFNKTEHHNHSTTNAPNIILYITSTSLTKGRLGNQMFRYASLLGIARAQGRQLIVPPRSQLQDSFNLSYVGNINNSMKWVYYPETSCYAFDKKLLNLPKENCKIGGYLQSYKYFDSISKEVKREFTFHNYVTKAADEILHDLSDKYKRALFVGVHVRRGDYASWRLPNHLRFDTPKSYFMKAFDWMRSNFPNRNITFLVAGDDLNWCKRNLKGSDVVVLPEASPAVHMAVLSKCDHMIISFGSYSWWSAWLSGGHVIYFTGFLKRKNLLDMSYSANHYPPRWIGLGE